MYDLILVESFNTEYYRDFEIWVTQDHSNWYHSKA